MKIQAVSQKTGLSQDTLRWYEKEGVIPPVKRGPDGQRDYDEQSMQWIRLAICLRDAGMSIKSIREYQQLSARGEGTIEARLHLLKREEGVLLQKHEDLERGLKKIRKKITAYEEALQARQCDGPPQTEG